MPTHIEEFVTEVISEPDSGDDGVQDKRFCDQIKTEAALKHIERVRRRLSAESFDD